MRGIAGACVRPVLNGSADIDPDNLGTGRIEFDVTSGPDPGIQNPTRQTIENQPPRAAIAPVLEWQLEQVVKWRYSLIFLGQPRSRLGLTIFAGAPSFEADPRRPIRGL